jgi:hypothetical protein
MREDGEPDAERYSAHDHHFTEHLAPESANTETVMCCFGREAVVALAWSLYRNRCSADKAVMPANAIRIVVGVIATLVFGLVDLFLIASNGYEYENNPDRAHTLPFAIPFALVVVAIAVLTVGATVSATRRRQWSILAVKLVLAVCAFFAVIAGIAAIMVAAN